MLSCVLTFSACEGKGSYVPCTTEWWSCICGLAMILLSGESLFTDVQNTDVFVWKEREKTQ